MSYHLQKIVLLRQKKGKVIGLRPVGVVTIS